MLGDEVRDDILTSSSQCPLCGGLKSIVAENYIGRLVPVLLRGTGTNPSISIMSLCSLAVALWLVLCSKAQWAKFPIDSEAVIRPD